MRQGDNLAHIATLGARAVGVDVSAVQLRLGAAVAMVDEAKDVLSGGDL
ncbi:hypothetical protein [Streptomyces sp. ISL-98]|nr:hypothetical protein [Streptomyces sp. ISL-98]